MDQISDLLDLSEHRLRLLQECVAEIVRHASFTGPDGPCYCSLPDFVYGRPHTTECQRIRTLLGECRDTGAGG